jgi:hypothetical protein
MDYPDPIDTIRNVIAGNDSDLDPEVAKEVYGLKDYRKKMKPGTGEDEELDEADKKMGVVNAKSVEDPDLYQDAEGGHAKIDTDELTGGEEPELPARKTKAPPKSDAANKASIAGKLKGKKDNSLVLPATESLRSLFDGENLSEDFMNSVITIFEVALIERTETVEEELREQHEAIIVEHTDRLTSELTEKVDDYLNYVVEEWVKENQLVIENNLRMEIAENFIYGLKDLFQENYVDIPDEKVDLFDELVHANEEVSENLNQQVNENIELQKQLIESRCSELIETSSKDMTDTESERFRSLAENISFESENEFVNKLVSLKENYFTENEVSHLDYADEELTETPQPLAEGAMKDYVDALSRTIK